MRRLSFVLLICGLSASCRERSESEGVSAPSAVDAGEAAKTRLEGEAAAQIFKAFAGNAPLNKDTGDFFHFTRLACTAGKCEGTLAKAGHEILLATGDNASQMLVEGQAADQARQALTGAGANAQAVEDLCCLTDGIKFACSFAAPQGSTNVAANASGATATATSTSTTTSTTTTTTQPTKKKPIVGSCYCGLHGGYCMIFKFGDELALGYVKATSCDVARCQQNFAGVMIDDCARVWRQWPVQ